MCCVEPFQVLKKSKRRCVMCGSPKVLKSYDSVCSKNCLENKLMFDTMRIPKIFIQSLYMRNPNKHDRLKKVKDFSSRHGYKNELVIERIKSEYIDFFPSHI